MPEILPGVHQIPVNYNGRRLNLHLLIGGATSILLDTGDATVPDRDILPYMKSIGFDPARLRYVIASHPDTDHTGGLFRMHQITPQALFCCGTADSGQVSTPENLVDRRYRAYYESDGLGPDDAACAKLLPRLGGVIPIDLTFGGGERLRLGPVPGTSSGEERYLDILHLPGHSAGHLGIHLPWATGARTPAKDEATGAPLGGGGTGICFDACQCRANDFLDGRAAFAPMYLNAADYLSSLRRLVALHLDRLYSCHWADCTTPQEVKAFLTAGIEYAEMAEEVISETLHRAAKPLTLREICLAIKPTLGDWPAERDLDTRFLAAAHLQRLMDGQEVKLVPTAPGSPRQFATA